MNERKTYSETLEDKYKTLKTSLWQEAVDATYTKFNWCALYEWAHDCECCAFYVDSKRSALNNQH